MLYTADHHYYLLLLSRSYQVPKIKIVLRVPKESERDEINEDCWERLAVINFRCFFSSLFHFITTNIMFRHPSNSYMVLKSLSPACNAIYYIALELLLTITLIYDTHNIFLCNDSSYTCFAVI